MQCVQRVKVCCTVLECVAVRYSVFERVAVHYLSTAANLPFFPRRCSAMQCVAVCCSALQRFAVRCRALQHVTLQLERY